MDKLEIFVNNLSEEDKEKLMELIAKASQPKSKVYKPEKGEKYFSVAGTYMENFIFNDDEYDRNAYLIGNCFKTKEEAEFMIEKLKIIAELKRFAEEHNTEMDWKDSNQFKYSLYYDYVTSDIFVGDSQFLKRVDIYFSSRELAHKAIDTIGKDRLKKYYFGVTE